MTVLEKVQNSLNITNLLHESGYNIVYQTSKEAKKGEFFDTNSLDISDINKRYLSSKYSKGIYQHQKRCIELSLKGFDVCLTTSTSSGKTLSFQVPAIESIIKNPKAKILAIYPLKALTTEQVIKWNQYLLESGLNIKAGKIDGSVDTRARLDILEKNQLIIVTPDIIQAWLLSAQTLEKDIVTDFLKNLSMVIVDEAHVYSGVFGSNSLFLFRNLEHICNLLGNKFRYIASSATIKNPESHLKRLFGRAFKIIDSKYDTSPKNKVNFFFVEPIKSNDSILNFSELLQNISNEKEFNTITFVDSRKQAEYIATACDKANNPSIMPYRSGLEEDDRIKIQQNLSNGSLKSIISTSALEMGIDIPFLNVAVLIGVPNSRTSLFQRIGRIGRHSEGNVIIINDYSLISNNIFRDPKSLFELPLTESALYMDNKRIQYQQAVCLASKDGAHDVVARKVGKYSQNFSTSVKYPASFIELCNDERIGDIDAECMSIKDDLGENPNRTATLRHCEPQYKLFLKNGHSLDERGSLTFSQVMREAYPGAIYYYLKNAYRVVRVDLKEKYIELKEEKKFTTNPQLLPTSLLPILKHGKVYEMFKHDDLIVLESEMNIEDKIVGYIENKGKLKESFSYPIDGLYSRRNFINFYRTTGIILKHPVMNSPKVDCDLLSQIIFEAFLLTIPFEKHDINYGHDKFKTTIGEINKKEKFISIYDATRGSLRLTSNLIKQDTLQSVLIKALEIARNNTSIFEKTITIETINAISTLIDSFDSPRKDLYTEQGEIKEKEDKQLVIACGSSGIAITTGYQEFFIKKVYYRPDGLYYKGYYSEAEDKNMSISLPIKNVMPIEGKSMIGYFDVEEDEIIDIKLM